MENHKYYGKFRGIVSNNLDPEGLGRIQAMVPDVLGEVTSGWAVACIPFSVFSTVKNPNDYVPPIGTGVWIEFENGDVNFPVWSGCRWSFQ